MKKLLVVLAILFIGILFAGCTSQPATPVATPTPTAVATPVPTAIATPIPTVVPTTQVVIVNVTPNATATPTPKPQVKVNMTFNTDMTISPGTTIYVPAGGAVVFINADPFKPHGIVATDVQTGKYFGSQDTVLIPYGKPLSITFPTKGAFDFKTVFQQELVGKIIVT